MWCMVPEIWNATGRIFVILDRFLTFNNFEKMKKTPGDIIILHMSTISSRDIERDGHKFLSFWTIFCRITPLTTQKIKILKKNFKKRLKISLLYTSVTKIMIICHTVPEIWRVADVIFIFHDGLFFCPFTPLKPKKSKFLKIG